MQVLRLFMLVLGLCWAESSALSEPMEIPQNVKLLPEVGFGDKDAPITVVMYHSLTCHHCSEFKLEKFPVFKQKYVDSGQVYFVLKDFPTDEFSLKLAIICWAGRNVSRYLERSQLIIENFNPNKDKQVDFDWVNADEPTKIIEKLLAPTGINSAQIQPLFDDRSIEDTILHDALTAGQELKLNFAPAFTVNGKLVELKDLDKTVDQVLRDQNKQRRLA